MTTQDSDISVLMDPPAKSSERDIALSLQARLSHLLSSILQSMYCRLVWSWRSRADIFKAVYKTEKTQLSTFLDTTRSILQTLAGHAQEVENIIHVRFRNSVDTLPRGIRHITLLYHQVSRIFPSVCFKWNGIAWLTISKCVIVATRPLLLSALKERLENLDNEKEDWQQFLSLTKTLICTGIKSATKTLQILSNSDTLLGEPPLNHGYIRKLNEMTNNIEEVFLLYDLEFAYGAAIHLAMANALLSIE